MRVVDQGTPRDDVIALIASNSRAPGDIVGDCHAQIEATRVAEQELFRLIDKYGKDDVVAAFGEVQDYVERLTRARIADLPDGTWETEDHVDFDPGGEEGLVTVKVKLDDRRRRDPLRPQRLGPGDQELPELRRGRRVLRRDRLRQDVPAGDPAELRLLPRDQGQRRARRARSSTPAGRTPSPARSPAPTRRS